MADIKEVARLAGVSIATVSRVVNNTARVNPETRERVLGVIESVRYSPNLQGQSLRKSVTKRVLVVLNGGADKLYPQVIKGIEDCARENEFTVFVRFTDGGRDAVGECFEMLNNKTVDGVILMPGTCREENLRLFGDYPVISCCEPLPGLCYVGIDYSKAGFDAVEYLIHKERRKIALFNSAPGDLAAELIEQGYRQALENAGISDTLVFSEGTSYEDGIRATKKMLLGLMRYDAILACSDFSAVGAIKQLSALGMRVPEDVSVMCIESCEISRLFIPSVTAVSPPQYDMGYNAMDLAVRKLNGRQIRRRLILPHSIITRESV